MRHSLLHTLGNAVWVARAERRRALLPRVPATPLSKRWDAGRQTGPFQNVLVHAYRKAGPYAPR